MKTVLSLLIMTGIMLSCAGCAVPSARSTPLHAGFMYANMRYSGEHGENANNATPGPKRGEASMDEFLWLFTSGNASITEAAKRGGITKLQTVDHEFVNVMCLYQKYTTIVTGE